METHREVQREHLESSSCIINQIVYLQMKKKERKDMRRAALFLMACVLSVSGVLFNNGIMSNVHAEEIEQVEEIEQDEEDTEEAITDESLLAADNTEENKVEEIKLHKGEIRTLFYSVEKSDQAQYEWVSADDKVVACIKNSKTINGDKVDYTCTVRGIDEGTVKVQLMDPAPSSKKVIKEFLVEVNPNNYIICPSEEFSIRLESPTDQGYDFKISGAKVSAELVSTEVDNSSGGTVYYKTYKVGILKSGTWDLTVTGQKEPTDEVTYQVNVSHAWDKEFTVDKAATCTEDGVSSQHCTRCDIPAESEDRKKVIKALGHKFGDWKVIKEPTYTEKGLMERICSVCEEKQTEAIAVKEKGIGVRYQTHVQSFKWQDWKENGAMSGTSGQAKRLEGIRIELVDNKEYEGDIEYGTHVQSEGWQSYVKNGATSGTEGKARRLEAIQIRLTGEMAEKFDIYYRVHAQSFGWMGWAKNDEYAGTAGYGKRLEGIEICLVEKGKKAPESEADTKEAYRHPIKYQTHVQKDGWQGYVQDGAMSGTSGEAKRLEGIKINLVDPGHKGDVQYRTHVQTYGWEKNWKKNGEMSGTSGEAKRLEAIEISLTGEMAEKYDIYYCVHAQKFGWMGWAKNGEPAGSEGYAYRLEGIKIQLVPKGGEAPGKTEGAFNKKN